MEFKDLPLTEREILKGSAKILIVDDSESDRFSFVRYLQSDKENSYHIIEAETLEEGLELWRSQQPDVVLLDINLPDGDGLEFLREIGTDQAINKLPVIMLTGQGDERIAVRAMKLGAADYLIKKDITALLLLTTIRQVQENDLLFQQLRRSQQQQTIIASMALHIRRSLNFEEVANQTVQEIRRFLEADRTIIYRFTPDMSGVIVAEAVIPPWLPCLNAQVEDTCFQENMGGEYQQGKVFAAADIYAANLTECHIQLLERFQVKANLVVPILLNGNNTLWGLLIAHQCSAPRQWHEEDIQLLHQLSVHLAIALQQAELYQNLQTMNSLLEEKVQERTKKLQLQNKVLEEIHDGVVTTDLNGIILSWNRGSEKLYGYTENEVLGRNVAFIYEDAEALQVEVIAPLFDKGSHAAEVVVRSKSGKRIYVSLHLSVVRDEQGDITHLIGCANDISDRKRAEQELQQLNQELETKVLERTQELAQVNSLQRAILESANYAIISTDLDGIIQTCNHSVERMLGYKPSELIGKVTPEIIHDRQEVIDRAATLSAELDQDIPVGFEVFVAKSRQGIVSEQEWTYIRKDDSRFPVLISVTALKNDNQQIIGFLGIAKDISDRKQAEEALRESERRFVTLAEAAPVGIFQTDVMGQTIYVNPAWGDITGRELEAALGSGWLETIHPEDRQWILRESSEGIKQRRSFQTEARCLRPDGTITWFYCQVSPKLDSNNNVLGYIGTLTDISDRKQAEQELLENQRLIQQIADSSPNVLYLYDVQQQRNAYANREILKTLGYSAIEVQTIGANWLPSVMHPDDLAPTLEHFEKLKRADDDEIFSHEYRLRHANGEWRYFYSRDLIFSRDTQGEVRLIIGTAQDITDRKLAEVQLQQKNIELQQLVQLREEALTLREDMSNMIVHDLRNPLSAMLLSAEIIQRYGDRPDQQALMAKKAEQILKSGNRLKAMIDSLLLMAKLESGKILFNPVPTDLHELGTAIVSDFELTAQSQRIELKGELPSPGNSIIIDAVILRRVIENLISNALKFSPPNSQVWLQIEYFPENHLRVKVIDNGPGVSPDQAEDIFKKFEIGTIKQNVSQIGLGLAFCKMAVEAQGGTLAIAPNQPRVLFLP